MKASYSMCRPHGDTDIHFGPVRHLGWTHLVYMVARLHAH